MSKTQSRQAYRHPVHLEVAAINGQPTHQAVLRNLTPYGTLLESPHSLNVGETIRFQVMLPDAEAPLAVEAQVKWSQTREESPAIHLTGLRFSTPHWQLPVMSVNLWESLNPQEKQALSVTLH